MNRKHGCSYFGGKRTAEYAAWADMRNRCSNPRHHAWCRYGARGIRVCERWDDFIVFLADMGLRPSSRHSIDRINNDGNYEPGNCRWATKKQQCQNRTSVVLVTHEGKTQCVAAWADEFGMGRECLRRRLKRGLSMSDALSRPRRNFGTVCPDDDTLLLIREDELLGVYES